MWINRNDRFVWAIDLDAIDNAESRLKIEEKAKGISRWKPLDREDLIRFNVSSNSHAFIQMIVTIEDGK